VQRHRLSAGNVVCLTGCARIVYGCSKKVGLQHVSDVTEISRRLTVAENATALAAQQAGDPPWNDSGVRPCRILPAPEDVEVAQADRLQPVTHLKSDRVRFVGALACGVRREGTTETVLDLR